LTSVHLLFSTNRLYLQHVAVCLTSLLTNNSDLCFDVVIVWRTGEELDQEKLQRTLKKFSNCSLAFREFNIPPYPLLPLNPDAHYTLDNWTRLWVEEFFPGDVDRVLYLDGDIIVLGSIAALWRTDLGGALLGAVDIPGSQQGVTALGMQAEDGYFNSGVLLIDLKQWRQTRAQDVVLRYVERNFGRLVDLDQDALNACFYCRRKRLEYCWNVTWSFYHEPISIPVDPAELNLVRRDASIIHFNCASKPWSYLCEHPRKLEYYKYLRMTEWHGFIPDDRTLFNRFKRLMLAVLPRRTRDFAKRVYYSRSVTSLTSANSWLPLIPVLVSDAL
jgi:lipopolysaccharide biosynthesis glycosyltransferase